MNPTPGGTRGPRTNARQENKPKNEKCERDRREGRITRAHRFFACRRLKEWLVFANEQFEYKNTQFINGGTMESAAETRLGPTVVARGEAISRTGGAGLGVGRRRRSSPTELLKSSPTSREPERSLRLPAPLFEAATTVFVRSRERSVRDRSAVHLCIRARSRRRA